MFQNCFWLWLKYFCAENVHFNILIVWAIRKCDWNIFVQKMFQNCSRILWLLLTIYWCWLCVMWHGSTHRNGFYRIQPNHTLRFVASKFVSDLRQNNNGHKSRKQLEFKELKSRTRNIFTQHRGTQGNTTEIEIPALAGMLELFKNKLFHWRYSKKLCFLWIYPGNPWNKFHPFRSSI